MWTVGTLTSLQQLDANCISGRLRREADAWASRHLHTSDSTQGKPYVSVQNRTTAAPPNVAVVRPVQYPDAPDVADTRDVLEVPDAPDVTDAAPFKDLQPAAELKQTEPGNFFLLDPAGSLKDLIHSGDPLLLSNTKSLSTTQKTILGPVSSPQGFFFQTRIILGILSQDPSGIDGIFQDCLVKSGFFDETCGHGQ